MPDLDREDTPSQVWMGGTPYHVQMGVPHPADRIRRGVPPIETRWGYLSSRTRRGPPPHQETDQHSEHSLHGGRCPSCVHAGGLSCKIGFTVLCIHTAGFSSKQLCELTKDFAPGQKGS